MSFRHRFAQRRYNESMVLGLWRSFRSHDLFLGAFGKARPRALGGDLRTCILGRSIGHWSLSRDGILGIRGGRDWSFAGSLLSCLFSAPVLYCTVQYLPYLPYRTYYLASPTGGLSGKQRWLGAQGDLTINWGRDEKCAALPHHLDRDSTYVLM